MPVATATPTEIVEPMQLYPRTAQRCRCGVHPAAELPAGAEGEWFGISRQGVIDGGAGAGGRTRRTGWGHVGARGAAGAAASRAGRLPELQAPGRARAGRGPR